MKNGWNSSVLIMLLVAFVFTVMSHEFLALDNIRSIVFLNTDLAVVVLGLAFIMAGGGFDLSVGYQISLISALISVMIVAGISPVFIVIAALLTGIGCGLLNGILTAYLNIVPFAATLATQVIFRGISYYISDNRVVTALPKSFRMLAKGSMLGVRFDLWIVVLCFLFTAVVFRFTFIGKYIRAIGLNEEAAWRSGIKVKRIKCLSYSIAGVFYALAAIIMTARKGVAGSNVGPGMEITGIAAAYIGGVLGQPAHPRIWSLILGVLTVAMIENRFSLISINANAQYIVTGVILILSMLFYKRKR